ncbi:hypothetical protein GGTG_10618 [Gaeumannomyces tritici R3-111a-1]|uniref:Uncharacterized protein n=1 Tax=Gaeumannomyces tritici (strain R3-111a-1) TaxID=644352 RepID=J3PAU3_GAET3|nr:hypothetical protein GGTG_10618 [Gaeumannomyces tritici R3-111a-1]EJT71359.1 hypothetical protein GGTG_10618 [Gaeumannomyces tritici R3-111a-1]
MSTLMDIASSFACCASGYSSETGDSSESELPPNHPNQEETGAPHPRFEPCRLLASGGIPSIAWFEDALAPHAQDLPLFDLYLLVSDPRKAADVLLGHSGYYAAPIAQASDPRAALGGIRLEGSMVLDSSSIINGVILLDAAAWNYDPQDASEEGWHGPVPQLDKFMAALMTYWVTMPEDQYRLHATLAKSLAATIRHGYQLREPDGQAVRRPGFADKLPPQLRELHYDIIGRYPGRVAFDELRKHEYHALRHGQILEGAFAARPYPSGNVPVSIAEFPALTGFADAAPWAQIPERKRKAAKKARKGKGGAAKAGKLACVEEGEESS